ncbi:hypothetical protein GOP47_0023306 [Adiantum capillus-veneris]|uniref:Uncharacterized protein n=1 Tax=Adiantum capillus-veneris TaxID=13818 RepID=A0A9D4Z6U3_ADICA|nr:hypothetical protein GOP47_0023306 [Adiantum capillus-veneris]
MVDPKRKGHRRSSSSASYSSNNQEKDFQCWASLRAIFGMMVPSCCGAGGGGPNNLATNTNKLMSNMNMIGNLQGGPLTSSIVTGTIFGQRKGRVNFCVQEDPAGPALLLLEFAIPTHLLVKEMQSGLLRITLECDRKNSIANDPLYLDDSLSPASSFPLFFEPVWSMYCNGRKVGFAMKKTAKSDSDPAIANLMNVMQSVTMGAGVIPCRIATNNNDLLGSHINNRDGAIVPRNQDGAKPNKGSPVDLKVGNSPPSKDAMESSNLDNGDANSGDKLERNSNSASKDHGSVDASRLQDDLIGVFRVEKSSKEEDELIYMRANYERVVGSADSEAFHMINPDGSQCQELSIFLTRS